MITEAHRGSAIAAVVLAAVFSLSLRPAIDGDYFWHVANGSHVADGILFSGFDRYSWTAAGRPWIAHEWLTEAVMATVDRLLGPFGNSILAAAVVALGFGLVGLRLRRRGVGWTATLTAIALAFAASLVSVGVRPQMLEIAFLALTLVLVDEWWRSARDRYLVALVLLSCLWAQTHGSFLLLPAVLGAATFAAALRRRARWPRMAVAAAGAAAIPMLNPWGARLFGFALQSMTSTTTLELVQEWRPPDLLATSFLPFSAELGLLALGTVGWLATRRRAGHVAAGGMGARAVADLLIVLAFLVLGLRSGRNVMLFGVAAAPLLAGSLGILASLARVDSLRIGLLPAAADERTRRQRRLIDLTAATLVIVVVTGTSVLRVTPDRQASALAERYPVVALPVLERAVDEAPPTHLFNEYTWGGFLIERAPSIAVFIDGRSEVYGDEQLSRYAAIVHLSPGWLATLETLGVGFALVRSGSPIDGGLERGGWTTLERDPVAVLYARP